MKSLTIFIIVIIMINIINNAIISNIINLIFSLEIKGNRVTRQTISNKNPKIKQNPQRTNRATRNKAKTKKSNRERLNLDAGAHYATFGPVSAVNVYCPPGEYHGAHGRWNASKIKSGI